MSDPKLVKKHEPKWYELDGLAKYRDLVFLLGGGLLVYGISRFNANAAFIVAGAGLIWLSLRMAR